MSLLRIVTGYQAENFREEVPAVLYIGYDADAAREAAKSADASFHRVELLESRGGARLRKQSPVIVPQNSTTPSAPAPPEVAEPEPADPEPVAEAPSGEGESSPESGDDGPSLTPRRGRR